MRNINQIIHLGMANKDIPSIARVANDLGYKTNTFRYKIRRGSFNQNELIRLFDYLGTSDEEIVSLYR